MKKLISFVVAAIAVIASYRETIAGLKAENETLRGKLADEDKDDAARDARLSELEALETEANGKADQLASLLNSEPAVPSVDPGTFKVTEDATVPPNDLAYREHVEETTGAGNQAPSADSAPASGDAPAPSTPPPAAAGAQ